MVNSVLEIDKPKLDYFFAALEGGLKFIKLDLHQQLALEKDHVTGCHLESHHHQQYFKKQWMQILQGIPHIVCVLH